jgi:hypothetical protein
MQKVVGSSPIIRFIIKTRETFKRRREVRFTAMRERVGSGRSLGD